MLFNRFADNGHSCCLNNALKFYSDFSQSLFLEDTWNNWPVKQYLKVKKLVTRKSSQRPQPSPGARNAARWQQVM